MEPSSEIRRLLDIMPASGRMMTKILSKPEQREVIEANFPLPWDRERPVYINFDLWRRLTKAQRDLLLLQKVSWLTHVKWFKLDIYQGVVLVGLIDVFVEAFQSDIVGVAIAGGLSAIASIRILRINQSQESVINADEMAINIAQRRGYTKEAAAEHLSTGIEAVAKIEGRPSLDFIELVRCQNLRAIAN